MTRRPVPSSNSIRLLAKVMVGWFARSRKSPERKCSSRVSLSVVMLEASMVTSTEESWGFSATWIVPSNVLKCPRTLVSIA